MRIGRRIAFDVGTVRIGIAVSDLQGILAAPFKTIQRENSLEATVSAALESITEFDPIEIYVGLPISMRGSMTSSTRDAIEFARQVQIDVNAPIRLIDERLTTVSSAKVIKDAGRTSKEGRKFIDQIAATIILEQALQSERNSENQPGIAIEDYHG